MCVHTWDPSASPKQPIQEFWQILSASPKQLIQEFWQILSASPKQLIQVRSFWISKPPNWRILKLNSEAWVWGCKVLMLCDSSRSPPRYLAGIRCVVQNPLAGWRSLGSFFNPLAARRSGKKVRQEKGTQFLNWQLLQKPGSSLAYAPVSKTENPQG
jgi:hypothetical protein